MLISICCHVVMLAFFYEKEEVVWLYERKGNREHSTTLEIITYFILIFAVKMNPQVKKLELPKVLL